MAAIDRARDGGMLRLSAAVVALLLTTAAAAQTAPPLFDMRGTWMGTSEGIVVGPWPADPPGTDAKPLAGFQLRSASYTYRIEGQDGKRFWGTASSDLVANERLVGSLSNDGKWIYMAGQDGILDGQIVDADTIEMCYRHANATSAVVGCNRMKRVK
jgi:hypothetical protein